MKTRSFLVLILVVAAGGCTALSVIPPEVSLVDLEFTDLTVFETTGEFTVRLTNENPEPLRINGGVFKLYLNGVKVGKALTSETVEVPGLGTTTQKAILYVNNAALVTRLAALLDQPVLAYRIRTRLFVEGPVGTRRVSFEDAGSFSWQPTEGELDESSVASEAAESPPR